jgi:hypothetical protein
MSQHALRGGRAADVAQTHKAHAEHERILNVRLCFAAENPKMLRRPGLGLERLCKFRVQGLEFR